jgi:hypothetical protein
VGWGGHGRAALVLMVCCQAEVLGRAGADLAKIADELAAATPKAKAIR